MVCRWCQPETIVTLADHHAAGGWTLRLSRGFGPADRAFSDSDSEGRSLAAASGAATAAAQTDSRSRPGLVTTAGVIRQALRCQGLSSGNLLNPTR